MTHVRRVIRKSHFKMNRAFKAIQGHPYWCPQKSRTGYCHNGQAYFRNVRSYSIGKTANSSTSATPTPLFEKSFRISKNNLHCQKLDSLTFISAADGMGLCLLLFAQLFLKVFFAIFEIILNALRPEVLAENWFWHQIATQGHSRTFILQSITG